KEQGEEHQGRPSTSHAVRDAGNLPLLLGAREGFCTPLGRVLRQEGQHGGADLIKPVCDHVSPPQQGVVAERDKTRTGEIFHDASYAPGGGLLVPGENQQLRRKATDGMRGDNPWTEEGEGGKHRWVRGGKSRPIAWRPAREVGS